MKKLKCKNCKIYHKLLFDASELELKYCFSCRSINEVLSALKIVISDSDNYGKKSRESFTKKIKSILLK